MKILALHLVIVGVLLLLQQPIALFTVLAATLRLGSRPIIRGNTLWRWRCGLCGLYRWRTGIRWRSSPRRYRAHGWMANGA